MLELIKIQKVDKGSQLAKSLIEFIKNFSWLEVKEHILKLIINWEFVDWESPFVAIVNNEIIGMATFMKTDYYPIPEIFPWLSTVFVTEEYRGYRISGKLIDYINEYAKSMGFTKTYIPTEYIGLYEKYGYYYVKDIVNYGNGVDRLYVKELLE